MTSLRNGKLSGLMLIMAFALVPLLCWPSSVAASANPTVTTNTATSIGNNTAMLNGEVTGSGSASVYEYGFYYGTDPAPRSKVTFNASGAENEQFNYELNGLDTDTTYYYEAYATNDYGTSYGYVLSFIAREPDNQDDPRVATDSAINIGNNTATLNGVVLASGGSNITEYGFLYGNSSTSLSTKVTVGSSITAVESFNYALSGLNGGTTYYFEAYATNDNGTFYGSVLNFTSTAVSNPVNVIPNSTFTIDSPNYLANGANQLSEVAPYIKDSRTLLPIINVAYSLGMSDSDVVWNEANQTVTLTRGTQVVQLTMGSDMITVNNIDITTDVSPEITDGRRCLPLSVVAMAFGATVDWNAGARTVNIQ